jgi:L-lactate dehydrogenase complex protein LldG
MSNSFSEQTTAREQILKKIRTALLQKTEPDHIGSELVEYNQFAFDDADHLVAFAKRFTSLNGQFVYCSSRHEFAAFFRQWASQKNLERIYAVEPWLLRILNEYQLPVEKNNFLDEAEAVVTGCESLIALSGSVVVSSRQMMGRTSTVIPHIHIVVAFAHQIVPEIIDAFQVIRQRYDGEMPSMISTITGPSRTADIEKTLVLGAHGPKEIIVFLLQE